MQRHAPLFASVLLLGGCAAALSLGGCAASESPAWDARLGRSVRELQASQRIDPGATERNGQRQAGADGRTVREAMERHTDSYRRPPPGTVITIVNGGGAAAP